MWEKWRKKSNFKSYIDIRHEPSFVEIPVYVIFDRLDLTDWVNTAKRPWENVQRSCGTREKESKAPRMIEERSWCSHLANSTTVSIYKVNANYTFLVSLVADLIFAPRAAKILIMTKREKLAVSNELTISRKKQSKSLFLSRLWIIFSQMKSQ